MIIKKSCIKKNLDILPRFVENQCYSNFPANSIKCQTYEMRNTNVNTTELLYTKLSQLP